MQPTTRRHSVGLSAGMLQQQREQAWQNSVQKANRFSQRNDASLRAKAKQAVLHELSEGLRVKAMKMRLAARGDGRLDTAAMTAGGVAGAHPGMPGAAAIASGGKFGLRKEEEELKDKSQRSTAKT